MYKVFVNDLPIILTDSINPSNNFPVFQFDEVVLDELVEKLKRKQFNGVTLSCDNLPLAWSLFIKKYKPVYAAGGLVVNADNDYLFIYRGQKWDLPKGMIEPGETIEDAAIREVEEECGVTNLKITSFLTRTYHLYQYEEQQKVKVTDWFLMSTSHQGGFTPQLEEGITQVCFKGGLNRIEALENTYANIRIVIDAYHKNLQ